MAALIDLFIDEGEGSRSWTCASYVRGMGECSPSLQSQPLNPFCASLKFITTLGSLSLSHQPMGHHGIAMVSCLLLGVGHAVHLWLVIRRRLKTQDLLRHWDNVNYLHVTCSLCESQPDSHEHLFFECSFSQQVWNQVKGVAGLASSNASIYDTIDDIIPFAARKTSKSVIAKLVVAATSYFIWQERNGRLFKNKKRTVNQVVDCIMNTVRLKLMSCRLKKSRSACDIVKAWNLSEGILIS
ncbi:reverse transcriptase domain, reverse transcriptase zinc-binding domain protein [Tanacetum coccineum]